MENPKEFRHLPRKSIKDIMKKALPDRINISKDCINFVKECSTEFICFIITVANEKRQKDHRKSLDPNDIVYALKALKFRKYAEIVDKYHQVINSDRDVLADICREVDVKEESEDEKEDSNEPKSESNFP
eukprot:TRINITY_DN3230_c0_g2_i1.p1 TRINITY_DN3230_c0_g2~~TRINITY_DN3230_c0_g2_i1.p1  ORF type:complete len:130 (+),score=42.05 TRINITY_DN3230_c0_g2_i1:108-497(+)